MENVYFIRHNFGDAKEKGKEKELREILKANKCIAIHFDNKEPLDEEWEDAINKAVETKQTKFAKAAKIFQELKSNGGYVLTQYGSEEGKLFIGEIEPGTRISYLGDRLIKLNDTNYKCDGFKCLRFSDVKEFTISKFPVLFALRPIQQTIARIKRGQKIVIDIFNNGAIKSELDYLPPKFQELIVQEWLRSSDAGKLQLKYQLILTGKDFPSVDLIGKTINNDILFVQVTYNKSGEDKSKFKAFNDLAIKAKENHLYVMFSKEETSEKGNFIFKNLDEVFHDLVKNNSEFITDIFQGISD